MIQFLHKPCYVEEISKRIDFYRPHVPRTQGIGRFSEGKSFRQYRVPANSKLDASFAAFHGGITIVNESSSSPGHRLWASCRHRIYTSIWQKSPSGLLDRGYNTISRMTEYKGYPTVNLATVHTSVRTMVPPKSEVVSAGNGVNFSYCTVGTEATSFSEDGDEHDAPYEPFSSGVFRIDDLFSVEDEQDSLSMAVMRTSVVDGDNSVDFVAEGLPREIVVVGEDVLDVEEDIDVHQRLRIAETLAQTYKAKVQSTETMADNLTEYLRQAQVYAEDVLADRDELLREIESMQDEEQSRLDQLMLLKVIMASSLCYYVCGGSPMILTVSVGLFLAVDALNTLV